MARTHQCSLCTRNVDRLSDKMGACRIFTCSLCTQMYWNHPDSITRSIVSNAPRKSDLFYAAISYCFTPIVLLIKSFLLLSDLACGELIILITASHCIQSFELRKRAISSDKSWLSHIVSSIPSSVNLLGCTAAHVNSVKHTGLVNCGHWR